MNRAERRWARKNKLLPNNLFAFTSIDDAVQSQETPALNQVLCKTEYEPRLVFRIEHPESGKGPFTHDAGRGRFASDAMYNMMEPNEFNVPQLRGYTGHHYAFDTIVKLNASIQSFVLLREFGFHIAVYESTDHIVLPDGQVAFMKNKATLIKTAAIHEFPYEEYA